MKRIKVLLAMITAMTATVVALPYSLAYAAYPSTTFRVDASYASVSGSITWYNRSVGLQGNVRDYYSSVGGYSQARFHWYLDAQTEYGVSQTRTASYGETRYFNFVQEGPRGGIRIVYIRVCSANVGGCADDSFFKPGT